MSNSIMPIVNKNLDFEKYENLVKKLEIINTFLESGNKPSANDYLKQLIEQDDADIITWVAITNNYLEIAKELLNKGSNTNIVVNNQLTPLHTMAVRNNIEGVALLLSFGANPELALDNGETALWTASRHGFNAVAYKLLLAGANPNVVNTDGWTPLMLATHMKNNELAFLLLQCNANTNIANNDGNTPIFYSMLDNNEELTKELLKRGAKLDIVNLQGQTPATFTENNTMNQTAAESHKISLLIEFHRANKPIQEKVTKFGGQPAWIDSPAWPISAATGKPMTFICQVKIEKELFPDATGEMAYIFMSGDEDEFIDDTYLPEGGENAVIIQPGNIPSFINTSTASTGPTIQQEFAVSFNAINEPFQSESECQEFMASLPNDQEQQYWELFGKTKIGGTPVYIQGEELPEGKEWLPLLQINSGDVPFYINFGDSGTAYIFINKKGNAGRMLWQCF